MYRITWTMSDGSSGQGTYCLTKDSAERWIKRLNTLYPNMVHWLECETAR